MRRMDASQPALFISGEAHSALTCPRVLKAYERLTENSNTEEDRDAEPGPVHLRVAANACSITPPNRNTCSINPSMNRITILRNRLTVKALSYVAIEADVTHS